MTNTEVKNFRNDFDNAVAQLQKKYGVNISTGTIRYTGDELRFKVTARKGNVIAKLSKDDFQVGDIVGINHKTVNSNDEFTIIKINSKNIKVKSAIGGLITVSPGLLVKK